MASQHPPTIENWRLSRRTLSQSFVPLQQIANLLAVVEVDLMRLDGPFVGRLGFGADQRVGPASALGDVGRVELFSINYLVQVLPPMLM